MNPQRISITGRPFFKYRALMDAMLNKAVEKMLAAGTDEGTVMGQIAIKLIRKVDDETDEVTIRPRFVFNTTMSIPIKVSDKDESDEDLVLFKDKGGVIRICDEQISMDDILGDDEQEEDPDDQGDEEPAEDDSEDGSDD